MPTVHLTLTDTPTGGVAVHSDFQPAGLKAKKKAQAAKAAETAEASPPLPSAAQADGVRGKGKPKKGPAAPGPKKPKTSAGEAMQGIAAAMQDMGEGQGADAGPLGADPDGASAVGEGGRATAPDAGAADAVPGGVEPLVEEASDGGWPFPTGAAP
jgi:hypothetical protein